MNLDRRAARSLAEGLRAALKGVVDRDIALFPTFVSVAELADLLDGSNIRVGGQNCSFADDGALTGEVSASILRSTGATHVILGHSERRHILGEDDEVVGRKMAKALERGLSPILCVGETLAQREAGETEGLLESQVRMGLAKVAAGDMPRVTIAYEPVWAIGTGKTATPEMANAAHALIRTTVAELKGRPVAADLRIQYGGSVKAENVDALLAMPDIDGALVGGASMDLASFTRIVKFQGDRQA